MARTKNGNFTGRAAQTARRELQEEIQESFDKLNERFNQGVQALDYLFGNDDDFVAWWDSYPEDMSKEKFLPIMESKIDELLLIFNEQDATQRSPVIYGSEVMYFDDYICQEMIY